MRYVIASVICGLLWVTALVGWSYMSGIGRPTESYVGTWSWEDEESGRSFEIDLTDTKITIEGQSMSYKIWQEGSLVVLITDSGEENPAGHVPVNEVAFSFKLLEGNKMELLSLGVKPLKETVLTRK